MFTVLLCIQIMRKIMILLARLCVIQQPNKTFVSYLATGNKINFLVEKYQNIYWHGLVTCEEKSIFCSSVLLG